MDNAPGIVRAGIGREQREGALGAESPHEEEEGGEDVALPTLSLSWALRGLRPSSHTRRGARGCCS